MSDIIKTQNSFAKKAMQVQEHRFNHLYRLLCQRDWITTALQIVLANKGARTPGIDGISKKHLSSEVSKQMLIQEIEQEFRQRSFKPSPVYRTYIPKGNGKKRPLGISTLKDRVAQMLLKMILEPIWESDFLNCSNGFRPRRRTMDCMALLDSYLNERSKYFWIVEGDIRGAFDNIHHAILLDLVSRRIADNRILDLIEAFLKAGIMQGKLFQRVETGTPQGAVCSPLLANLYLHQLDKYWWQHYGGLHRKTKERRRQQQQGNCGFIRYADDWLLLTNGSKQIAYALRDEFQRFLEEELKLELSVEKTHVTHVNDGFDFLGFHVQRYVSNHDKPKMFIIPSEKSKEQLKAKIREMTDRQRFRDSPLLKFNAINIVLCGWINYYRHSNVKTIAKGLDFWVNQRVLKWLQKRHKTGVRETLRRYRHRENNTRYNLGVKNGDDKLFLYRMSDCSITKYRSRKPENPYLTNKNETKIEQSESPLQNCIWLGNAEDNGKWREIKAQIKAEYGARCAHCGSTQNLDLHHKTARRDGGRSTANNAQLLCKPCHVQTPSYGAYK
jgi:RNA-directed DNA polymerase